MLIYFFKFIFKFYFKITGWTVQGHIPNNIPKGILVGGGHTSNWDLIYALGTLYTLDMKFNFIIKKEALVFPMKKLLLSLGALPIDRNHKSNMSYVEQIADIYTKRQKCYICISPEGTRSPVKKWKTGYYHIAKIAGIPIIPCYLDYINKVAYVCKDIPAGETPEATEKQLREIFKKAIPKHPEKFNLDGFPDASRP